MSETLPASTGGLKLAQQLAEQISQGIMDIGWPVGEVFGSEADLLERYQTSRASLREAIRILERQGIAKMQRGPRGGLTIIAPVEGVVAQSLAAYLEFTDMTFAEVLECRAVLEKLAVRLAAERINKRQRQTLLTSLQEIGASAAATQKDVQAHMMIRHQIAEATQNPALSLFLDMLSEVTTDYLYFDSHGGRRTPNDIEFLSNFRQIEVGYKRDLVESILNGNVAFAEQRVQDDLDLHLSLAQALQDQFRKADGGSPASRKKRLARFIKGTAGESAKLPEVLARTILMEIREMGWPVGERLGSEPELIETFDVSRAALREAIRLLERDNIVQMRRGSGGGLFIASPTPDNVVATAVKYLVRMKLGPMHYIEVRSAVEGRAAELAAERLDDEGTAQLVSTHEQLVKAAPKDVAIVASLLHVLIGQLSGNRALSLFLQILINMTAKHMVWRRRSAQRAYDIVRETHPAIVDAILARNPARAREAMLTHVDRAIRSFR